MVGYEKPTGRDPEVEAVGEEIRWEDWLAKVREMVSEDEASYEDLETIHQGHLPDWVNFFEEETVQRCQALVDRIRSVAGDSGGVSRVEEKLLSGVRSLEAGG